MKGIIIFEDANPTLKNVYCIDVANSDITMDTKGTYTLTGKRVFMKTAACNKEDTYDFETGALIALMKMCGRDKVVKACDELYRDDNYKNALQEMTESFDNLSKKYDLVVEGFDCWKKQYVKLDKENKELHKNIDELFESEQHTKSELGRLYFEKHRLEEENEKLKLDCEKLQHGYNDTYTMFCGGRQNGKQYKALVELFKKLPQDKIDAAYREAYNTTLPVWQKEALRQAYEIYKESKEKIELPRTLDINGTVYRKSIQIKDFGEQINKHTVDSLIEQSRAFRQKCVEEWLYRIPTKREEMWEKIFELHKESDVIIKVKREDVNTFLHELEDKIPEITWASGVKIFETKYTIKDIFKELKIRDVIYFRLWKVNKLSYSSDQYIYPLYEFKHIDYLPPMRWDLFKKGRLVVKVDSNNYEDFYNKCEIEIGRKPLKACERTFTVYYEKGTFHRRPYNDTISFAKKIVNWEDVR